MNKNISPKLMMFARVCQDLTRHDIAEKYPNITVHQLRKIENNLDMDLYADPYISKHCIKDLEDFIRDSGMRFANYGEFTGIFFSNTSKDPFGTDEGIEKLKAIKEQDLLIEQYKEKQTSIELAKEQLKNIQNQFLKLSEEVEKLKA
jgi:hypothetical protein